ncbi:AAA family ATPase [Conexibacter sp. W3-3-2]|nr:AAA family ATPase [Conexibacter sp. W3-3-2]
MQAGGDRAGRAGGRRARRPRAARPGDRGRPGAGLPAAVRSGGLPHLGAQLAGTVLDPGALVAGARAQAARSPRDLVVVEGVGGLLVPLTPTWLVRDLAVELALPVVVAARPALGTINHTLLTLAAARDAGLDVRAVILTPWPAQPSTIEASNRETLEALAGCEVAVLPRLSAFDDATLAAAGAALSPARWIGAGAAAA